MRGQELTTLTYAAGDRIARVVLNRPAQLDAISPALLEDLDQVCEAVERDRAVRVVALTAAGRAFCAGADLEAIRELVPDLERWRGFMKLWHRVFKRIEGLPVPVVAGVHGLALAGGLELVLVADLVVEHRDDEGANEGRGAAEPRAGPSRGQYGRNTDQPHVFTARFSVLSLRE